MKGIFRSPTRVDLAGGTLDLWPLYNFLGEAWTVNLAISVFTEVQFETTPGSVSIESKDLKKKWKFDTWEQLIASKESRLRLYQTVLKQFPQKEGFRLITQSESPVGGGLGGSSSLVISLIRCFLQQSQQNMTDHEIVHLAHNLEAQILNTPTGTQDYYPALCGGLQVLHYTARGISARQVDFANSPLATHMVLVYTGQSHHSGINNFEVMKKAVQKDKNTLKNLRKLNEIAFEAGLAVEQSRWEALPQIFDAEYAARTALEPSFGSEKIEKLRKVSLAAGARSAKICGAGGGGCVLLWVEPERQKSVKEACQKNSFQVLTAKPLARLDRDSHI